MRFARSAILPLCFLNATSRFDALPNKTGSHRRRLAAFPIRGNVILSRIYGDKRRRIQSLPSMATNGATGPSTRRLAIFVGGLFAAESASVSVIPPLIPRLLREFSLTTTDIGVLVAVYPVGIMIAALPSMTLVSRFGLRRTTLAGIGAMIIATAIFGWTTSLVVLDIARFAQGAGGAVAWTGALAWLTSTAPPSQKGSFIGGAVSASLVGSVCGAAIGAGASQIGRAPVFSVVALGIALLVILEPASAPAAKHAGGSARALLRLLQTRDGLSGSGLFVVIGMVGGIIGTLIPLVVLQRHGTATLIAAMLTVSYLLAALLNVVLGRVTDRTGRLWPAITGMVLLALLLPLLPVIGFLYPLVGAAVVAISIDSALSTPAATMVSDGADVGATGQAVGVAAINAAWAAGGALGPIVAASLADIAGFPLPFAVAGAMCSLVAVLLAVAMRGGPPAPLARSAST